MWPQVDLVFNASVYVVQNQRPLHIANPVSVIQDPGQIFFVWSLFVPRLSVYPFPCFDPDYSYLPWTPSTTKMRRRVVRSSLRSQHTTGIQYFVSITCSLVYT
jgi:hypothetical protein